MPEIIAQPESPVAEIRPDQCTDWCVGDDECEPDLGTHVSAPAVASAGGPLEHDDAPVGWTDVSYSVGVNRYTDVPHISVRLRILRRDPHGWAAPMDLNELLPSLAMNSARARHLSRLLAEAADTFDRLTGGAQ